MVVLVPKPLELCRLNIKSFDCVGSYPAEYGVVARDDMVTPLYFTEELVRLIPNARAYVLPDGGHFYPHVHGDEFRRVMTEFLLESR